MRPDSLPEKTVARFNPEGLGWQHDLHDFRDFTPFTPHILGLLRKGVRRRSAEKVRPDYVDLREFFPAVCDQEELHSSCSHVCVGLVQYFELRALGIVRELSSLFLYQTIRSLMRANHNVPDSLRTALKAMVHFGLPPEALWPYDPERFTLEPDKALFAYAQAYRNIAYFRLDQRNTHGAQTLDMVRSCLAAGFPVGFGFPVPSSISMHWDIPYRPTVDSIRGGQAVIAVGYDDFRAGPTRGALLIRNSWGGEWGENGYGWLPYRYVEEQLATDFWTLISPDWISTGELNCPDLLTS